MIFTLTICASILRGEKSHHKKMVCAGRDRDEMYQNLFESKDTNRKKRAKISYADT